MLFNALSYISGATFTPYITTYYKSRGVSVAQIGVLTAVGPLIALFPQPLWGVLADRTGRHLLFLRAAAGSMLAVRILLLLLPGYFFLVLAQCLEGVTYMVMYYCTVMFMNENLGEELRGTGMAFFLPAFSQTERKGGGGTAPRPVTRRLSFDFPHPVPNHEFIRLRR